MTDPVPEPPLECRQMEAMLPPFVDGCASPEVGRKVEAHLERCGQCRDAAAVQRAVRGVLVARRSTLAEPAPAGLSAALLRAARPDAALRLSSWLSPRAAAAALVLAVGAPALWAAGRSSVLLAAQLTLDHLKCFIIDGDDHSLVTTPGGAEADMRRRFDDPTLSLPVPPSGGRAQLVAVRECLYSDGWVPHALYRVEGRPVSLFLLRGTQVAPASVDAFGRRSTLVTRDGSRYLVVAPADLVGVAGAVGLGAQ